MKGPDAQIVYNKHNSFVEIRQKDLKAKETLQRIIAVCAKDELCRSLSVEYEKLLAKVIDDLLYPGTTESSLKFSITPNVICELMSLEDKDLPQYLVHRYRYEMFPFLKLMDNFPPYLQIEPTSRCNFRCVFCYQTDPHFTSKSGEHMGNMSVELFMRIIDQAEGNIEFISLASRGEPLLCPDIETMLGYTRNKFLNLKMNTNASLLDEKKCHAILQSGIKTLVFSVDAADEILYSSLRKGGNLQKVFSNIERFAQIRQTQYKDSKIITRVSGVKYCQEQSLDSMEQLWGDIVDQVVFVSYNPWENIYCKTPSNLSGPCSDLWRRMFVWWDGRVNPCDVDYRSTLSVGNATTNSISELWKVNFYNHLRSEHASSNRHKLEPCRRCSVV